MFLALLLHDAVYEPGRKDNEARSAELAAELIARHLPGRDLDLALIAELIELTAHHGGNDPVQLDHDAALFVDCDMAILGAEPARFDAYDRGVALEYQAVPRELYLVGRRRFLAALLTSEQIYLSDHFRAQLEAPARANLARALDEAV